MKDNSGLNAGDITNGAHTKERNKSSNSKNKSNNSGQSDLEKFVQNFQSASANVQKQVMSILESSSVVGAFIKQFRALDKAGQERVAKKLSDPNDKEAAKLGSAIIQRLREIQHPEIQKPEIYDPLGVRGGNKDNSRQSNGVPASGEYGVREKISPDDEGRVIDPEKEGLIGPSSTWTAPTKEELDEMNKEPVEEEVIEYTYKPGDTFGQVLLNLGLSNGRNLWGPNGDVAYYTKQLNDQGIYGNIPIGKKIRLVRKKNK